MAFQRRSRTYNSHLIIIIIIFFFSLYILAAEIWEWNCNFLKLQYMKNNGNMIECIIYFIASLVEFTITFMCTFINYIKLTSEIIVLKTIWKQQKQKSLHFFLLIDLEKCSPLKDCVFFFCKTNVKCVQNSYHSFSDTDINYKPSMKNVQSFQVIRFLTKM